jgi:hypothetical protein
MLKLFQAFLQKVQAGLRSLSKSTREEVTVEELESDAWIVAHDIGAKRGREIDFTDPADQNLILRALNVRNVKRPERHMLYADRIDQEPEDLEGEGTWASRLQASESSDPLVALLDRESEIDPDEMLAASYSQAAAYVIALARFGNKRDAMCAYLVIADVTLRARMGDAAHTVRTQPSLFDRIDRIPADFMPPPGKEYAAKIADPRKAGQWAWDFEEAALS